MKISIALTLMLLSLGCNNKTVSIEGTPGPEGPIGPQGGKCTVTQLLNGALIQCDDGTQATVFNGLDGIDGVSGVDGEDGQDAVIAILDPCGHQSAFDEVLFKLTDNRIYAVYADLNSQKIHLTELTPGQYNTTDGTNCVFSVVETDGDFNIE